jgi:hypothetical protein
MDESHRLTTSGLTSERTRVMSLPVPNTACGLLRMSAWAPAVGPGQDRTPDHQQARTGNSLKLLVPGAPSAVQAMLGAGLLHMAHFGVCAGASRLIPGSRRNFRSLTAVSSRS